MRYLWLFIVVLSLVLGAWSLRVRMAKRSRVPVSARASSDDLLAFLKLEGGAESLRRALARVPEQEAILFVGGPDGQPAFTEIFFTISLLALPHPVGGLRCLEGTGEVVAPLEAGLKISAVVFYRWEPGVAAGERLAPGLTLLRIPPRDANGPWTSFCSSPRPPSS